MNARRPVTEATQAPVLTQEKLSPATDERRRPCYHDSSAALLVDGQVAAAQEERFTRKKQDSRFPHHAIRACLQAAGVKPAQIDRVAFYDKPFLKFERLLENYLAFAPRGFESFRAALPVWVKDKLFQRNTLLKELKGLEPGVDSTE